MQRKAKELREVVGKHSSMDRSVPNLLEAAALCSQNWQGLVGTPQTKEVWYTPGGVTARAG